MVNKTVRRTYRDKFQPKGMAQAAGMAGQNMGHEDKGKPAMMKGFGASMKQSHQEKVVKEREELKPKVSFGQQAATHDALYEKREASTSSVNSTSPTVVTKTVKKVNLNDFASILKNLTGEKMEENQLDSLVKKFTGGDINLGNLATLIQNITGKTIDLGALGKVVQEVTGNTVEESDLVEKSSTGGGMKVFVWIILLGVGIYILTKMF